MKVLIFHGYLLRGTGSNVYNANVAQALSRLGHEVHLFCQDREAAALDWVDAVGTWSDGELTVADAAGSAPGSGSITAYLPDIGGVLPLYVADTYAGFDARPFPDLSEDEVEAYISANVGAVRDVAARADGIDASLANHLVMGPVILARAIDGIDTMTSFAAKVHGSALSYTVIPNPDRFLPYAREGMEAARTVLVGSHHTAQSLWETVDSPGLEEKTRLGPPGVDVEAFSPLPAGSSPADELQALAGRLEQADAGGLGRDLDLASAGLRSYAAAEGPRVVFVGKLIVSKGCDLLLVAWPLVASRHPGARLMMVGFGEYRDGLARLWSALSSGDLDDAREVARLGWALEGGEEAPLSYLSAFLADPPEGYAEAARAAAGTLDLAGRLEYTEVAHVVRSSDAMVVPSTFPEAFGMVAAEAASTGALPVCAHHSGLAEVAGALADDLPGDVGRLTSFGLGPGAVAEIAANLNDWLALPAPEREAASAFLTATVRARWSWESVGRTVVTASEGDLGDLVKVS